MTVLEDRRRIARAADIERFVGWLASRDEAHTVLALLANRFQSWIGCWGRDDLDPRHLLSDDEWEMVRWLMDNRLNLVSDAVRAVFAAACLKIGREDVNA